MKQKLNRNEHAKGKQDQANEQLKMAKDNKDNKRARKKEQRKSKRQNKRKNK